MSRGATRAIIRLGRGDCEPAVVGEAEVEGALHVLDIVAAVPGDERRREVRVDDHDVPFSPQPFAGLEGRAAHPGRRLLAQPDGKRTDERRGLGERLVAGGGRRREVARVLEGRQQHRRITARLGLELMRHREQQALGARPRRLVCGDELERRRSPRWARCAGHHEARARAWRGARQWGRVAEEPSLAVAGAERASDVELALGLDALGQQPRAGALRLRVDRMDDRRHVRGRPLLHEPQVELDHLGADEGHQRERPAVGPDIVERDGEALLAQTVDSADHVGRAVSQRSLGELDDDVQLALGAEHEGRRVRRRRRRDHRRLDVDEERRRWAQAAIERTLDRRDAAGPFELDGQAGLGGSGEQAVRAFELGSLGPARQSLVGNDLARLQVDDRLVDAAHVAGGDDVRHGGASLGCHLHESCIGPTPRTDERRGSRLVTMSTCPAPH